MWYCSKGAKKNSKVESAEEVSCLKWQWQVQLYMYVQSYSWYRLETYMYRLHHWTIGKSLKIYKKGGTMGVVLANIHVQEVHIAIVTSRDTQLSQYPSKWHSENAGTCTCSIEVHNVATYHFLAWSWVCRAAPLQEQGRPESFHCQCEQHPSNLWKITIHT